MIRATEPVEANRSEPALNAIFAALSDPTRRAILQALVERDQSVGDLVRAHSISQPAISKHLKTLESAGLISRHAQGATRYARLEARELDAGIAWMRSVQAFWQDNFDQMEQVLDGLTKKGNDDDR